MPVVLALEAPRAGGSPRKPGGPRSPSPRAPAPAPPPRRVCIPFAGAFQRPLTAHAVARYGVVCLPAIRAFQRHNTQHLLRCWSLPVFAFVSAVPLPVLFDVLVWQLAPDSAMSPGPRTASSARAWACGMQYDVHLDQRGSNYRG
jgi:hypothetical protein